jgi:uncharacterized protein DUF932
VREHPGRRPGQPQRIDQHPPHRTTRPVAAPATPSGPTCAYTETFQARAEAMIQQTVTDAEFFRMTAEPFPAPDRAAAPRTHTAHPHRKREYILTRLWADADTQAAIWGTAWATTRRSSYLDNHSPARTAAAPHR